MHAHNDGGTMLVYPEHDTTTQARQLVRYGMLRNRWLLINGIRSSALGWKLATAIEKMLRKAVCLGDQRLISYGPKGVFILELHHIIYHCNYEHWDHVRRFINVCHVQARDDPYKQASDILLSGMASKRYVILRGTYSDVRSLLRPMRDGILRGSCNGIRIIEPRPLGLCVMTRKTLFPVADYSTCFVSGS